MSLMAMPAKIPTAIPMFPSNVSTELFRTVGPGLGAEFIGPKCRISGRHHEQTGPTGTMTSDQRVGSCRIIAYP
jgi:hypothetical protein